MDQKTLSLEEAVARGLRVYRLQVDAVSGFITEITRATWADHRLARVYLSLQDLLASEPGCVLWSGDGLSDSRLVYVVARNAKEILRALRYPRRSLYGVYWQGDGEDGFFMPKWWVVQEATAHARTWARNTGKKAQAAQAAWLPEASVIPFRR